MSGPRLHDIVGASPDSLAAVAAALTLPPPVSVQQVYAMLNPLVFQKQFTTGGAAALGGWVRVSIFPGGRVLWEGHAKDSGLDGYDYTITAAIRATNGMVVALRHSGHVGGDLTSGEDHEEWSETLYLPGSLSVGQMAGCTLETHLEYESDIGSTLESAITWLTTFYVGALLAPVTGFICLGFEAASFISTGSLVPGARIIAGTLWMAGPANTLYALFADAVASEGTQTTPLSYELYDWANAEVFNGSLPPRDKIIMTDTIGGGNRAFTFPRFDGKITLNMGPAGLSDPRDFHGETGQNQGATSWGTTFIHELVHACQIENSSHDISYVARALSTKLCFEDPYDYPGPNVVYTDLNMEAQAQIVSDWYCGAGERGQSATQKDIASPFYPFIFNNVWTRTY